MRNKPNQKRSFHTIEFISEAAIQLLNTHKVPNFTTNHIAERAGVSVGTLYRYFPDKGAVLRFIVRRELKKMSTLMIHTIETSSALVWRDLLNEVVDVSLMQFGGRPKAKHMIRELVERDADLLAEVQATRLFIVRRLGNRFIELEPSFGPPPDEDRLVALDEAFRSAVHTLAMGNNERVVAREFRIRLAESLFQAFLTPQNPPQIIDGEEYSSSASSFR